MVAKPNGTNNWGFSIDQRHMDVAIDLL